MQSYLDFVSCEDALTLCSCRQKLCLLCLLQGISKAHSCFSRFEVAFPILDHTSGHTWSGLEVV